MADLHAKSASGSWRLDRPYADQIRRLIEQERISAARSLLAVALAAEPDNGALASLHKVLAPPRVQRVPSQGSRGSGEEFGWLLENGERYRGQWVAIRGCELLAHADSLKELRILLEPLALPSPPLVHHLAEEP